MKPEMTPRQRLRAVLACQPVDRLPRIEWATWWGDTLARWYDEGLPRFDAPENSEHWRINFGSPERYDLYRYFGLDMWRQAWISADYTCLPPPAYHGAPLLSSMDEYLAIQNDLLPRKEGVWPFADSDWRQLAALQESGDAIWITLPGFFWFPRTCLGIEPHLYAFHDEPELLHRMNSDLAAWHLDILRYMERSGLCPDMTVYAEDLSYNLGPMLSQAHFEEFLLPYYRQSIPELNRLNSFPVIDSDGDVTMALPWFINAGLKGLLPLERAAGVDVGAIRKNYSRFVMIGAYDKMVMPRGEQAMRAEFERLLPTMRTGGFIPSVDHQTPPGVSLEQYRIYLRLLEEYTVLAVSG